MLPIRSLLQFLWISHTHLKDMIVLNAPHNHLWKIVLKVYAISSWAIVTLQHITLKISLKWFAVHLCVNFLFSRYLFIDPNQESPHSIVQSDLKKYTMLPTDSFDILHQRKIDLLDTSMLLTRIHFSNSEMFYILEGSRVETTSHTKTLSVT